MNAERQTHSEDDMALDLGGLLRTIGRSLGWLAPLTLFVTVVVFLGLQFVAPKYKGEARLIIESTDNLPVHREGRKKSEPCSIAKVLSARFNCSSPLIWHVVSRTSSTLLRSRNSMPTTMAASSISCCLWSGSETRPKAIARKSGSSSIITRTWKSTGWKDPA